jgi:WD40 repeat protein
VVRYSPDGNYWASGGFDGKIFLYDGKFLTFGNFFIEQASKL